MDKITLDNIAGYEEEKREAAKIITLFQNYDSCRKKGINIPKGLLITGRPGVGKTLLAKAIINQSGVPCFEYDRRNTSPSSSNSFKDLFNKARKHSPCIVFIDEIHRLVPNRMFTSDTTNNALGELLTEMDGSDGLEGVMVIATCNSTEFVPGALVRSGRMDKKIDMREPDFEARKAIIEYYLNKYEDSPTLDTASLADSSNGLTGADIKTLVNEVMSNAYIDKKQPTLKDFEKHIAVIRFETIRLDGNKPSDYVAYHEIGHFLVQFLLTGQIGALSIENFGKIKGYTTSVDPDSNRYEIEKAVTDKDYENRFNEITVCLAGLASDELFTGKKHGGASKDLECASKTIERMAIDGMFGAKYYVDSKYDEITDPTMIRLVNKMIKRYYRKAKAILKKRKPIVEDLKELLLQKEYLSRDELTQFLTEKGIIKPHLGKENPNERNN